MGQGPATARNSTTLLLHLDTQDSNRHGPPAARILGALRNTSLVHGDMGCCPLDMRARRRRLKLCAIRCMPCPFPV